MGDHPDLNLGIKLPQLRDLGQQNDEKAIVAPTVTTSVTFARIASTPSAIFEKLSVSFAPRIKHAGVGSIER